MINQFYFKVEDSADNDYGKNSKHQCVSFYESYPLPPYCVIMKIATWKNNERAKQGEKRKGYFKIHHRWCCEKDKKYDEKTEKVYGNPEKIIKKATCIFVKNDILKWDRTKFTRSLNHLKIIVSSEIKS